MKLTLFEAIPPKNGACLVIAEAGVNHNGSLDRALEMVRVAAQCGADVVKFQTFRAADLASATAERAKYQARNAGGEESQLEMLQRLELDADAHRCLQAECQKQGIAFLSTPFEDASLDLLLSLGVPALKVSSGDLTNIPFLRRMARSGLPIILSTGMATMEEIEEALQATDGTHRTVLQCVSDYPAQPEDANLRAMATIAARFEVPIGYSDHCLGNSVSLAAVALGATVVEKHFTLDPNLPGPDHAASSAPDELASLVAGIREILGALGDGVKGPKPREQDARRVARKSVVAAGNLPAGHILEPSDLLIKRPATGIAPRERDALVGRTLARAVQADAPLVWEDLA